MSEINCPNCGAVIDADSIVCPECRYVVMRDEDESEDGILNNGDIFPEGTVISGDYRIVRMIGMGGAGTVYEARQTSLQNVPVALKVLHPDLSEDQNTIALLKKEVIIARELTHDNIMKVYSLGMTDDRHFIVMEYFAGQSLQDILDKSGKCSVEKASAIFVQICDALQYAHDRGIIHLDIKPANILVGPSGNVKLCDFGIARMAISNVTTATQRIITGSVGFMPPEQYRGRKFVSHRSDIYSLAATYYNAVTGEVPIGILEPEGIPQAILRAMDRNPDNRFQSVEEFHNAFIEETGYQPPVSETPLPRITLTREVQPPAPAEPEGEPPVDEHEPKSAELPTIGEKPPETVATPEILVAESAQREEPKDDVAKPRTAPHVTEPEAPREPTGLALLMQKPVYLAGVAALIGAVMVVIALTISGKEEAPKATRSERAKTPSTAEKTAVGQPDMPPQAQPKNASFADVQTVKADAETTEAVLEVLGKFVELLNFDQVHQAYMFLSSDLRAQVPMEQFEKTFFASPRLWKAQELTVGKTSDGKILIKLRFRVMDAYQGAIKTVMGDVEMVKQDPGWKITNFHLS